MVLWSEVRPAIMLQVVAPYVAEMLHLKALTINRVAGVAGFQTMSTCKLNINSLPINVIVVFLLVFLRPTPFYCFARARPAGQPNLGLPILPLPQAKDHREKGIMVPASGDRGRSALARDQGAQWANGSGRSFSLWPFSHLSRQLAAPTRRAEALGEGGSHAKAGAKRRRTKVAVGRSG